MTAFNTIPNPDLTVRSAERAVWNSPDTRRWGFHNLHRISRHGIRLRARNVLPLARDFDMRIETMPEVQRLTHTSMFSAMAVVRDARLLYERYAPDFGPERPHAIMSISKTMMHLIYGQLTDAGLVDPNAAVETYLPEIGSGYARARVRDVLDMNVANDYSEDYSDPHTSALEQEVSMGWRVPAPGEPELSNHAFLCSIRSDDIENRSSAIDYKSANTDVLELIAERVSGRPIRDYLVEIAEAAGLEDSLYVSTDRGGTPILNGGCSLTARDLARYGGIFAREGLGVEGRPVGSPEFLRDAMTSPSKHRGPPRDWQRYRGQLIVIDRSVGHGGFAGQFLLANLDTRISVAFFSVLETLSGSDEDYVSDVSHMAQAVCELPFE